MTEGTRLDGLALVKLVEIVENYVHEVSTIDTFATSVNLTAFVNTSGSIHDRLTSLIKVAEGRPAAWRELIPILGNYLKDTNDYSEFLQWREQNGLGSQDGQDGQAKIRQTVSEVRKLRNSLLEISDPREGTAYLQAMRDSIIEIKVIIESMAGKASSAPRIVATAAREAAAARGEILFCCEKTLREVDQLTIDIIAAGRQSTRIQREYSGQEVFAAERSMLRHLLNDRGLVDLESGALLEVIERQMAHLGILAPGADLSEQAVPPQRAGPGP
jgi:hypothetical protein